MRHGRAVGFLSRELSGSHLADHEEALRRTAHAHDFELSLMIYTDLVDTAAIDRLFTLATFERTDAVFVYTAEHIGGADIAVQFAPSIDVIVVESRQRFSIYAQDEPRPEGEVKVMDIDEPGPNGSSNDNWNEPVNVDDDGQDDRISRL